MSVVANCITPVACGLRASLGRVGTRLQGDAAEAVLGFYTTIPSYQKVIAREGVDNVADLAAIGAAESVLEQLRSYLAAGASDLVLSPLRGIAAPQEALWEVAAAL